MEQPKLNIDLKNTTAIKSEEGNQIFQEGFILRKASRFITGGTKDSIIPIPIFFDILTGKPIKETLPIEFWEEFGYITELSKEQSNGNVIPFVKSEDREKAPQ